ncbi:MAG: 3D-(3,5/4)-trihydroxycyclohexane-1,2-dione acylhydrolase (decyclizing) [Spirochaetaceae bacterium 4572_59]|nr:MAG: 3D-(3,5/4)-trihydroxycyclohexane-1,2-dione acylhydrolase (decyclizing) [Spirochaetaceae bacterium 4572_59]
MGTIRMTVAQALVKFLNQQYLEFDGDEHKFVEGIFTVFGHGNVLGLGQALEEDPGTLKVHQGRNEQGMAAAAMGFAKQNHRRKIFAATSSVGPGAANMVTAAATATANRIPVLFLPGDTYATRQPDPVLQQMEQFHDLTLTTNDAFRAVSKYWDRINRPEQLMTAMISAMRTLTDPANTGAVTICLPQDVQGEAYDYPDYFFQKRVHRLERTAPTDAMITEAVAMIKKKKKPLLICGGGVRYSEAGQELLKFAEEFNIPYSETQAGKSATLYSHPLNVGGIGTTGCLAANTLGQESDLIIAVGTRYTDFTTASKWLYQNPDVDFVNINIASFDSYKMDAVRVTADAKAALIALRKALKTENYKSSYTTEIKAAKEAWDKELDHLFNLKYTGPGFQPEINDSLNDAIEEYSKFLGTKMTQTRVLGILDEVLDDSSICVGAAGSLPGDLQRVYRAKSERSYHMEYGYSCMGYEINAALGVKMAEPEREVYAYVGDGSFMMLHSELVSSIQEGMKINVIIFDNVEFGCINNLQMERGQGSFGTEMRRRNSASGKLDGELLYVDFARIGEGYGCKSYTVKNEEELKFALEDAKKQTVSTVIDVKVLPKTMTHGYEGFWRCGQSEVAKNASIVEKTEEMKAELHKARQY